MKEFKNSTFDIQMTTMRDLNPDEVDQVGGGVTPTITVTPTTPEITATLLTLSFMLSCSDCAEQQE